MLIACTKHLFWKHILYTIEYSFQNSFCVPKWLFHKINLHFWSAFYGMMVEYVFKSKGRLDNYNFDCFCCFTILVCMEDDYFNKMFNEVDMDMDKNVDDALKNEDCSNFFTTTEVILSCYYM